jgi:opacity protein-like surface antigen
MTKSPPKLLAAVLVSVAACALTVAAPAEAQLGRGFRYDEPRTFLQLRGGYSALTGPRAQSGPRDLFGFTRGLLTIGGGDFDAPALGADVALRISSRWQIVGSVDLQESAFGSEYRDWVDQRGRPILQENSLARRNVDVWARYLLRSPGERLSRFSWIPNRLVPFVGAGVGATRYRFEQDGSFVNFATLDVFRSTLASSGTTLSFMAAAGLHYNFASRTYLIGDVRYRYARAGVEGDFQGFDDLDLSGVQVSVGFGINF